MFEHDKAERRHTEGEAGQRRGGVSGEWESGKLMEMES